MTATLRRADPESTLAVGDVVEVRPAEEILAGLDERGELDSLPFMPEMLAFCGRRFVVDKIAFKTCDTVTWTGLRRLADTVHLAGVRCDGQGHGGCQAGCLVFWKTAWLTKASGAPEPRVFVPAPRAAGTPPAGSPVGPERPVGSGGCGGCTRERLVEVARGAARPPAPGAEPGEPVYSCQATELTRAAPERVPFWDVRQYVQDVRTGNAPARQVVRGLLIGAFNLVQDLSRRTLPERLRIRGGRRYPFIEGTADRSPVEKLDLQPGEWVRIKSLEEITATLKPDNHNRGLSFDPEMIKYCGRTARVLRRVDQIIDEQSGRMISMKTPCIVMADVTCASDYHRNCPRGIYSYWREIWLERVAAPTGDGPRAGLAAAGPEGGQR